MGSIPGRGGEPCPISHLDTLGFGDPATWQQVNDHGTTTDVYRTPGGYLRVAGRHNQTGVADLAHIIEAIPDDPRLPKIVAKDTSAVPTWLLEQALSGMAASRSPRLDAPAVVTELADLLCRIHETPIGGPETPPAAARVSPHRASVFGDDLHRQIAEHVSPAVADRLGEVCGRFPASTTRVLIHADATANNVLVSPDTGLLVGLVDFEWAHVGSPLQDLLPLVAGATRHFHVPSVEATLDAYVRRCPHIDVAPTVPHLVALLAVREAAGAVWDVKVGSFPEELLAIRRAERLRRIHLFLDALCDVHPRTGAVAGPSARLTGATVAAVATPAVA